MFAAAVAGSSRTSAYSGVLVVTGGLLLLTVYWNRFIMADARKHRGRSSAGETDFSTATRLVLASRQVDRLSKVRNKGAIDPTVECRR